MENLLNREIEDKKLRLFSQRSIAKISGSKISLKIHQAISRFPFFFSSLMPRQKYGGHFSRATVFQHTSGEVFPRRKLSRAGRSSLIVLFVH